MKTCTAQSQRQRGAVVMLASKGLVARGGFRRVRSARIEPDQDTLRLNITPRWSQISGERRTCIENLARYAYPPLTSCYQRPSH